MNPKISVAVDLKNKALSTVSGMLTVGADVDVEVRGLPSDIPNWGDGDVFSGLSLRFRIVDEHGRDLARYPLKDSDTWTRDNEGVCRTDGALLMDTAELRKCFCGVPFDGVQDLCVIIDSVVDKAQYAVGRIKVKQWRVASSEDPTVLPDWRDTLEQLNERLSEVGASKNAAEAAAKRAEDEAGKSADSARDAANKAQETHEMRNDAIVAKNAAVGAKTAAEVAITRYPKIGANGNWWVWDVATGAFVDTGYAAKGGEGEVDVKTFFDRGVKLATINGSEVIMPGAEVLVYGEWSEGEVDRYIKYVGTDTRLGYGALERLAKNGILRMLVEESAMPGYDGSQVHSAVPYRFVGEYDSPVNGVHFLVFAPIVLAWENYGGFPMLYIGRYDADLRMYYHTMDEYQYVYTDVLNVFKQATMRGKVIFRDPEKEGQEYTYKGQTYKIGRMLISGDAIWLDKDQGGGIHVWQNPVPLDALLKKIDTLLFSVGGQSIESSVSEGSASLEIKLDETLEYKEGPGENGLRLSDVKMKEAFDSVFGEEV